MSTIIQERVQNASIGLTAAAAVWIATAVLHSRYPDSHGFSPSSIRDEVIRQHLTDVKAETIYQHIVQHLVATLPANPNRRKMLTDIGNGMRRLFVAGDAYHPSKRSGLSQPKPEDLPPHLRMWLDWYEGWSHALLARGQPVSVADPLEVLAGTWTFGDADAYLRELREGWE